MLPIGIVLILVGWSLLILATDQHARPLLGYALGPTRQRVARAGAACAMAASLALFVAPLGWQQGPVFWAATLMLGGLAAALASTALQRRSNNGRAVREKAGRARSP